MSNDFGRYLRKYRNDNNLTLRQLEEKTGITFSHLSKIERGEYSPSRHTVELIANALGEDKNKLLILAGYVPEGEKLEKDIYGGGINVLFPMDEYASYKKTIELLEEEAEKMGLHPGDPEFIEMLKDAIKIIRVARKQNNN